MKSAAFGHPKFRDLARRLGIEVYAAEGLVARIWATARVHHPNGAIGRWTNDYIALAIEYRGNADELVSHLIECKLLDSLPEEQGRLYIHDWHVHCEDSTHVYLARKLELFARGDMPKMTRLSRQEREALQAAYREQALTSAHCVSAQERTGAHRSAQERNASTSTNAIANEESPADRSRSRAARPRSAGSHRGTSSSGSEHPLDPATALYEAGGKDAVYTWLGTELSSAAEMAEWQKQINSHLTRGATITTDLLHRVATECKRRHRAKIDPGPCTMNWFYRTLGDLLKADPKREADLILPMRKPSLSPTPPPAPGSCLTERSVA